MESTECGEMFAPLAPDTQHLETVRALHQTVVALRVALDKSRTELEALRLKVRSSAVYTDTIEKLSLENHILRQRILDVKNVPETVGNVLHPLEEQSAVEQATEHMESSTNKKLKESSELIVEGKDLPGKTGSSAEAVRENIEARVTTSSVPVKGAEATTQAAHNLQTISPAIKNANQITENTENSVADKGNRDAVKLDSDETKTQKGEQVQVIKSLSESSGDKSACSEQEQVSPQGGKNAGESDNESEEVDDIELIFTTEETKELGMLQEDLVSITEAENWQPGSVLVKFSEADHFDELPEEAQETDGEDRGSIEDAKDASKESNLTKVWTQSVLVETDISKCGVVDEIEQQGRVSRRNTLPNPLIHQPIVRDPLPGSRGHGTVLFSASPRSATVKFSPVVSKTSGSECKQSPVRPILSEKNAIKRESEAQTDITALPSHWKSESYLAHKVAHNFTTLPSKFTLPVQQLPNKYSLRLSEKTREARRTLLSDINFTSMVPELSRSADHLCQDEVEGGCTGVVGPALCRNYPHAHAYMKNVNGGHDGHTGSSLISPGYSHFRDYGKDAWSPSCDCSQSGPISYGSSQNRLGWDSVPGSTRYRGSLTSITHQSSYEYPESKRRYSWRPSPDSYHKVGVPQKPTWGSVPSSPTRCRWGHVTPFAPSYATPQSEADLYTPSYWSAKQPQARLSKARTRNRVTFFDAPLHHRGHPGQSLPDLRADVELESGDSTDSLIDEAEEYLRRSIDSMLTGTDWSRTVKRRQVRRVSEPDPIREFRPPKSAHPFLPKIPRDLKLDYFVKVITNEGRVMVGRVRYVGSVPTKDEPYVGVELPQDAGNSDGSFEGRRFFDSDPDKAVFVPFKKVVMAWSI
ncbi:uncharacterized protein LOC124595863 [Schistocerca americana]|uniref:uncharacterized protein LOC124595863 n=1 Tax=Schistocerca americana TaxID=7009 RepID=UPI001F4FB311|nr:uncharacterized protein LOC124595863 [Schistocerca americana]